MRRWTAGFLAMLLAAALWGVPVADAHFSGTTASGANTWAAANSFGLYQQPVTAGCVSDSGTTGACAVGPGLDGATSTAVSPDGAHVYAVSVGSDAVTAFTRNSTTGAVAQLPGTAGCVSETGSAGACADGRALVAPTGVTVSPDGAHVYVVGAGSDSVAAFARDTTTGALTQLAGTAGCVSETGTGGACTDGRELDEPYEVVVSPDGGHAYTASAFSDAVVAFSRNATTGALTQLTGTAGCISETGTAGTCTDGTAVDSPQDLSLSADGKHLYVASASPSNAVAVFARNATTGALTQPAGTAGCISESGTGGACADGTALDGTADVVVAPDGSHVYATAVDSDAVTAFTRNATTGALTQLAGTAGCVSETGTGGTCADGVAMDRVEELTVTPDGAQIYTSAVDSDAVVVLARNATTGVLTQLPGTAGCISETGSSGACADTTGLDDPDDITASPDGRHLYVAARTSDAVHVLTRHAATGVVTPLSGCTSELGGGGCADGRGLDEANDVAVSPDGAHVYVVGRLSDAVDVFARDTASGALSQLPGTAGCVSETGTGGACADGRALVNPTDVVVSGDGKHVYVGAGTSNAIGVFARNSTTGELTQLAGPPAASVRPGPAGRAWTGSRSSPCRASWWRPAAATCTPPRRAPTPWWP